MLITCSVYRRVAFLYRVTQPKLAWHEQYSILISFHVFVNVKKKYLNAKKL